MTKKKFLRRDSKRFSTFGKRRKKMLKWRRPTGRDNKMREKRKGYPVVVSIGYAKEKNIRGTIQNKKPVKINNLQDLKKLNKNSIGILGKIGKKKKIEIAKKAIEMKVLFTKFNPESFLKKLNMKKNQNGLK
ncbi:MAG: eL32 family ribosomal protein [Candidatus Pacearchaeota archaeon]|jgi:large subunit ribosomal protein L32e